MSGPTLAAIEPCHAALAEIVRTVAKDRGLQISDDTIESIAKGAPYGRSQEEVIVYLRIQLRPYMDEALAARLAVANRKLAQDILDGNITVPIYDEFSQP